MSPESPHRNRRAQGLAAGLLAVVAAVFGAAPGAHATTGPAAALDPSAVAALASLPCDPGGVTSADSQTAAELNDTLTAKLRGAMTGYRVSCARMVAKAVRDRGLPIRAATIAITTTIVESSISNLDGGDQDSVGLFQQRGSWGSYANRTNPVWATNAFLDKMVSLYPNDSWQSAEVGDVCQAVQVSAYPDRYQPQAADAQRIADAVWNPTPPPTPRAHGTLWDRGRSPLGAWDVNSTRADANPASIATAAATLPNGQLHMFVVIPGSGVWSRVRNNNGVWGDNSTRIDSNGAATDVAASVLPDGSLHLQVLVPGSGIWDRTRSAAGHYDENAVHIDTNPDTTAIASAALPDGSLHVQALVPGSGVWDRVRGVNGTWTPSSTHIDTNPASVDVASAALPDGTLHVQVVVPGSGIWDRTRSAAGHFDENAVHIDSNGAVTSVSSAGAPDGTLHVDAVVPHSGVWHRTFLDGTWASTSVHADTNPNAFDTYTAAMPTNGVHLGILINAA